MRTMFGWSSAAAARASRFLTEPQVARRVRSFRLGGARPTVREGQRVIHPRYGAGIVTRLEAQASGQKMVNVTFDEGGEKRLALAYARLQPA